MREVVGSIPAVPLCFFCFFWPLRALSYGFRPESGSTGTTGVRRTYIRRRVTGVVVVGVGAGLASPQRSGDARPTSDGGLASPQPSRNRHMLRDDGASGRRRARLFSIVHSDDTDFFESSLPALVVASAGEHGLVA